MVLTLCDALRQNTKLRSLAWDKNGISTGGWQALLNVLGTVSKFKIQFQRLII